MKKKYNTESKEMVMNILSIGPSSFSHYAARGIIKPDRGTIFSREGIYRQLGIKHKTDEPLIGIVEVAKILGIKPRDVVPRIKKKGLVPYYSFKEGKGGKYYFLRSEVMAALASRFQWDNRFPDFHAKRYAIAEIAGQIIDNTPRLSESQRIVLKMVFVGGSTMPQISKALLGAHPQKVRDTLAAGMKTIKANIGAAVGVSKINAEAQAAAEALRSENAILRNIIASNNIVIQVAGGAKTPISTEEISTRLRRVLLEMGIKFVGEMAGIKRSLLLCRRDVGEKTIKEADMLMARHGLSWMSEGLNEQRLSDLIKDGYSKLHEQNQKPTIKQL